MASPPEPYVHPKFSILSASKDRSQSELVHPTIFLAGTLAPDWRTIITKGLSHLPVTLFNPVRPDWDSSWTESPNFPPFSEQVRWELMYREMADLVVFYFSGSEKGAGSVGLLELGIEIGAWSAKAEGKQRMGILCNTRVHVCCEKSFWKRGYVEMVCSHGGVMMYDGFRELVVGVKDALERELERATYRLGRE